MTPGAIRPPVIAPSVTEPESFHTACKGRAYPFGGIAGKSRHPLSRVSILSTRSFDLRDSGAVAPSAPAAGGDGTLPVRFQHKLSLQVTPPQEPRAPQQISRRISRRHALALQHRLRS